MFSKCQNFKSDVPLMVWALQSGLQVCQLDIAKRAPMWQDDYHGNKPVFTTRTPADASNT
jgi:hypothetical protein